MARRRVADWKKLSQWCKGKKWPVKLTWFSILGTCDDYGLALWSPANVAIFMMEDELNARMISVRQVTAIMEEFTNGDDPEIVTWESGGHRYLAVPKHQDYQRVRLPSNADCPLPPPEILRKLSRATRTLITENLQNFTSRSGEQITENDGSTRARAAREGEVEEEVEVEGEGDARARGRASEANTQAVAFLQGPFSDGYIAKFPGTERGKVPIRWKRGDPRHVSQAIQDAWVPDRMQPLVGVFFATEDAFIIRRGFLVCDFVANLAGLEQAHKENRTHGSTGSNRARSSNLLTRGSAAGAAASWKRPRT